MSDEEDRRRELELERELWHRKCRAEFLPFCIEALQPIGQAPAKHQRLLITYLEALLRGDFDRLLVLMPYGSAKSTYVSRLFIAWALAHIAGLQVIFVGNTEQFALDNAGFIQRIIKENSAALDYDLTTDRKDLFGTTNGGRVFSTGVGGTVLGFRANLIVADDLIRSREEAYSQGQRDKQYGWFSNDLLSRRLPDLRVVCIGTPQHEDDILARLQNEPEGRWRVLRLPAEAEENDPLGRAPGEFLWADDPRDPSYADDTKRRKAELLQTLPHLWYGPYQLQPYPPEGDLFHPDKMPIFDSPPKCTERVRAWDLAASAGKGDATCGMLIGRMRDPSAGPGRYSYIILDVQHDRLGPQDVRQLVMRTAKLDGASTRIWLPQDPGSAGVDMVDSLTRMLSGYPVKAERMSGNKETRAMIPAAQLNAGRIGMVKAPWNAPLKAELASFPGGRFDDQVDALSLGYSKIEADSTLAQWLRL
jgi:predicted phage terminase large subunit-like protein